MGGAFRMLEGSGMVWWERRILGTRSPQVKDGGGAFLIVW